jgi:hypothetical protein
MADDLVVEAEDVVAEVARPYMPTRGASEDWCTPPKLVDLVVACFGGRVDLDPCANPWSMVSELTGAQEYMLPSWDSGTHVWSSGRRVRTLFGDGISRPWLGHVFVNPPYGRDLDIFMDRALRAAMSDEQASVIMLLPAKTSRRCWQRAVPKAAAVAFLGGRIQFLLPDGRDFGATFSSSLVLWTRDRELTHRFSLVLDGKAGHVMFGR